MRNQEEFIMKPKVDFCFKELMEDGEIRKGFIAAVLNVKPEEIGETELLPTHLRKTNQEEKLGILDVRVKIDGKHMAEMDMEIQVAPFPLWAERSLFYLCSMFVNQIHRGQDYDVLKKCIHVGLLDFILYEEDEEFYSCIHLWKDKRREKYTDKLEIHIVELPKWNLKSSAQEKDGREELRKWARFLHAEKKEEFEMAANTSPYVEKAYERLMYISTDEEKRREYEEREKAIRDYNWLMKSNWRMGHEEGIREGIKQGVVMQVCRKLRKGKVAEVIAEELEEDLEEIMKICQAAQEFAPDYDSELVIKKIFPPML